MLRCLTVLITLAAAAAEAGEILVPLRPCMPELGCATRFPHQLRIANASDQSGVVTLTFEGANGAVLKTLREPIKASSALFRRLDAMLTDQDERRVRVLRVKSDVDFYVQNLDFHTSEGSVDFPDIDAAVTPIRG